MKFLTLAVCLGGLLLAQEGDDDYTPESLDTFERITSLPNVEEPPEESPPPVEKREVVLKGAIVFEGSLPDEDFEDGIHFYNLDVPGNPRKLERALSELLVGKPLSKDLIREAETVVTQFFKKNGHPLVIVHTPEQKISNGILRIAVVESRIGKVTYKGNRHFSDTQIQKQTHLEEGGKFNTNVLQDDLIWLNRNPFRNSLVILNPGVDEGTTDIDFITKDDRPYRLFTGFDNSGFEATGENRFFAGIKLANLFKLDQRLSYQYTASTQWGDFFANTAQYVIPLPWRHIIDLYGGYSTIRARMPITGMSSKGNAWQGSGRYIIPLKSSGTYTHEVKVGFDYKQTNVNLVLDAIPVLGSKAMITQIMTGYNASMQHKVVDFSLYLDWFFSPGDIFPFQSDSNYQSLRPSADSTYTYVRFATIPIFHLPRGFQAVTRGEFQVSSANLLSSEQFGLGGINTVRGYDERILNTDNAGLFSLEFRTPRLRPFTRKSKESKPELLQFLAFLDYGLGANHKAFEGEKNFRYLLSTGLGMRYQYNYNVSARADWGYPLHKDIGNGVEQNNGRFDFSVIVSF